MTFKKVQRKVAGVAIAALLISSTPLHASLVMGGRLIPQTPFDSRLMSAGILNLQVPAHTSNNLDTIFGQAKAFRYKSDAHGNDHWQTPEETEARWAGDCEDKAVWLFAQLKKNGYEGARLVVGRKDPSSNVLHAWVTLDDGSGNFFLLDPTAFKRVWRSTDFSDGSYKPLYSFDGTNRYRHDL